MFSRTVRAQVEQPRKVWLHIGHGKTGTTALQKYFVHRAKQDPKFHYPETGQRDTGAHHDVFPLEFHKILLQHAPARLRALRAEIEARPHDDITVLSSEHLCYFRRWQVKQLLKVLRGFDVHVLYYVRRQEELVESTYKWWLVEAPDKHNGIEGFARSQTQAFDFMKRLEPWLDQLDLSQVHCRLYHRETCGTDIVSDVEQVLGLDPLQAGEAKAQHRESLDALRVDILRAFDRAHPNSKNRKQFVKDLVDAGVSHGVRSQKKISNQLLRSEITAAYAESNKMFAERFLREPEDQILLRTGED